MVDYLIIVASSITALGTLVLAVVTCVLVLLAKQQLDKQFGPFVLVSIEQIQAGSTFFGVVVRNVGKSPAFKVKAEVVPANRSVDENGILSDLQGFLRHERPMLMPGQVVCRVLDNQKYWQERSRESQLQVNVEYALKHGKKPKQQHVYDISPSWPDEQLLGALGVWREVDARVGKIEHRLNNLNQGLARIASTLEDKDGE